MPARPCIHCGTPVPPGAGSDFCCAGCEFVHRLIREEGMDRFYDLRGGAMLEPVGGKAFVERDWSWLEEKVQAAERQTGTGGVAVLEAGVDGVSCIACLWLIEKLFQREPGALDGEVHPATGRLRLRWRAGKCEVGQFARRLLQFGYTVVPAARRADRPPESSELRLRLGLTAAFAMNCMVFTLPGYLDKEGQIPDSLARIFGLVMALSATLALAVGGSYFIRRAWAALRHGVLHMDFPIALGVVVAWVASMAGWLTGRGSLVYFDTVSVFLCLMLLGRLLQVAAVERSRNRAAAGSALPREVADNDGHPLPLDDLRPGMVFRVPAGGVVPVASLLEEAAADISLEWINGESEPEAWSHGRRLPSGAVNLARRAIRVRADETWAGSLLERLAGEADGAQAVRRPVLERVLRWYVLLVVVVALLGGGVWLAAGGGVEKALQVAVSVLVVSCPCAIGLAMPLADELARSTLQRAGVFLRRDDFWGRLAGVRTFVFDKTGTLTMERPELVNPEAVDGLAPEAAARLRDLVAGSLHPVGRRLLESVGGQVDRPPRPAEVEEVAGQGLRLRDAGGACWSLGRPSFEAAGDDDGTEAYDSVLRRDGRFVAGFSFRDALRPESVEALRWLAAHGFACHLLSGDRPDKVAAAARQLGLDPATAHAAMSPADKAEWVARADPLRRTTLYLGDGANDVLACQQAACSGTPLVDRSLLEEKADFYFTGRGLGSVAALVRIGRLRSRAVRSVVVFAAAYNLVAVGFCLAGLMHPLVAAIAMPSGSLLILALTVLHFRRWLAPGRVAGLPTAPAG